MPNAALSRPLEAGEQAPGAPAPQQPGADRPEPISVGPGRASEVARRNRVGTVSLLIAVGGTTACWAGLTVGPFTGASWLRILTGGFEAAVVGGLADWFAITALFRHPLGLPIPHTAILPARRQKLIDGIVSMLENDWLSPEVIGARLERFAPSGLVIDWLGDPAHVERLAAPLRDLLHALARMLGEAEVAEFLERAIHRGLEELPVGERLGELLGRAARSESAAAAFASLAVSLANLADRPRTAAELQWWIDRSARKLREGGQRLVPFFLRRKLVQRRLIEAACAYASSELRSAAADPEHPFRRALTGSILGFAERLEAGEAAALEQAERIRAALLESFEPGPLVRDTLLQLRDQLEHDLDDSQSQLSRLVDRKLHAGIVELLEDVEHRAAFDRWVRSTARSILERHHHEIGRTVRENLEALDTGALVQQVEDRVGADLQFIRLNGALVGGLIGLALALGHWLAG